MFLGDSRPGDEPGVTPNTLLHRLSFLSCSVGESEEKPDVDLLGVVDVVLEEMK